MRIKYKKNKNHINIIKINKNNLVWILVFILFSLHVFFAVQSSSTGVDISYIEDEISELEKENEEISIKLVKSTSLTKLSQASEEMGFTKIENTLYLQQIDSFAKAK
jgi:hypothetical protein